MPNQIEEGRKTSSKKRRSEEKLQNQNLKCMKLSPKYDKEA